MTEYAILIYGDEAQFDESPEAWAAMMDAHGAFAKAVAEQARPSPAATPSKWPVRRIMRSPSRSCAPRRLAASRSDRSRTPPEGDLGRGCDECAQEAYVAALQTWADRGIPDSPGAWLTTTARR